jgi:signal peptidase I
MNIFKSLASQTLDFLETIALAFIIFVLIDTFVMQPHIVKGNSMLPDFHTKERIFTESVSYRFYPPKRGDVVVFKYPYAPENEYIKRIVGLPGEEIRLNDGEVTIFNSQNPQGLLIKEPYLKNGTKTLGKKFLADNTTYKIPNDTYFVLGDNREESSDSREWGTVPKNNLVGRVFIRYWPPSALSAINGVSY